jgi:hypothetical protein
VTETVFLYRALRPEEVNSGVLIPKACGPFIAPPRLPQVLPFVLGERTEHAVRAHQWNGEYPTSGVSTTPHLRRAEHYAQRHRMIAKIPVERLAQFGIQTFRVSEYVDSSLICVPEDDESILVCPDRECFPGEIIADIFQLPTAVTNNARWSQRRPI